MPNPNKVRRKREARRAKRGNRDVDPLVVEEQEQEPDSEQEDDG